MRKENCKRKTYLFSLSAFYRSGRNQLRGRYPDLQVVADSQPSHSLLEQWHFCEWLAAYSGGTVRDSHPLPFSLTFDGKYLEAT